MLIKKKCTPIQPTETVTQKLRSRRTKVPAMTRIAKKIPFPRKKQEIQEAKSKTRSGIRQIEKSKCCGGKTDLTGAFLPVKGAIDLRKKIVLVKSDL